MYQGCFYLFGVKPTFFTDEDDHSSYIACEANMVAHGQFLDEITQAITLHDLLTIAKPVVFTCPEMIGLQKTVNQLTTQLETERAQYDDCVRSLNKEAANLREIMEFSKDDGMIPYRELQKRCAMLYAQEKEARQMAERRLDQYDAVEMALREEYRDRERSLSVELAGLYESVDTHRAAYDTLHSKFKRAVADGVEKERQKEKAEKEKKKEAKEKEKLKKALKAKEAKKKLKRAEAIAKAELESDSDSDSDSETDED
jgi:hypothetical protein